MAKKQENKTNDENILILPISGKKVEFDDIKKADGHLLIKARQAAEGGAATAAFIYAELCKIDGEKVTAEDILDLPLEDVVAIEDKYVELKKLLISARKT